MSMNTISINNDKFKKSSKKLLSRLHDKGYSDLKLNMIQEILAESLGYRNLFELQKIFENTPGNTSEPVSKSHNKTTIINFIPTKKTQKPFSSKNNLNLSEKKKLLQYLINSEDSGQLNIRKSTSSSEAINDYLCLSFTLLTQLNNIYSNPCMPKSLVTILEKGFCYDSLKSLLNPDNIYFLYSFIKYIQEDIKNIDVNTVTLMKKTLDAIPNYDLSFINDYLKVIYKLKYLEENDLTIFDYNWINWNYPSPTIQFVDSITCIQEYYFSWFDMDSYKDLVKALYKSGIERFSLLDLLVYSIKTIDPHKKELLTNLFNHLLDNFEFTTSFIKQVESSVERQNIKFN